MAYAVISRTEPTPMLDQRTPMPGEKSGGVIVRPGKEAEGQGSKPGGAEEQPTVELLPACFCHEAELTIEGGEEAWDNVSEYLSALPPIEGFQEVSRAVNVLATEAGTVRVEVTRWVAPVVEEAPPASEVTVEGEALRGEGE